eukprot:gene61781-84494_t
MELATRKRLAIGNGILTVEDEEQAWARARVSEGDKGGGAARACLENKPASLRDAYEKLVAATDNKAPPLSTKARRARTVARLAAVQALYQMELAGTGVDAVVREFTDHRFDGDLEGETLAEADEVFFSELVHGVVGGQAAIDSAISHRLAANWRLERVDATLRAILRAGGRNGRIEGDDRPRLPVGALAAWQ